TASVSSSVRFAMADLPRAQPCFPTRRSSDLESVPAADRRHQRLSVISGHVPALTQAFSGCRFAARCERAWDDCHRQAPAFIETRSEEHTSELQSRFDLVCRLLPEKKTA